MTALIVVIAGTGWIAGSVKHTAHAGLGQIQHVVVIMQENRTYDTYFGTYPGGDGIPNGYCNPDPATGICVAPYHDPLLSQVGGPHAAGDTVIDINKGLMNGFIMDAEKVHPSRIDVMGYKDQRELPLYWSFAEQAV